MTVSLGENIHAGDVRVGMLRFEDGTAQTTAGGGITIKDENTQLPSEASTLKFTGVGVTASGTGGEKTINIADQPHVSGLLSANDYIKRNNNNDGWVATNPALDVTSDVPLFNTGRTVGEILTVTGTLNGSGTLGWSNNNVSTNGEGPLFLPAPSTTNDGVNRVLTDDSHGSLSWASGIPDIAGLYQHGYQLTVNSNADGLEWADKIANFTVPDTIGHGGKSLALNSNANGLEWASAGGGGGISCYFAGRPSGSSNTELTDTGAFTQFALTAFSGGNSASGVSWSSGSVTLLNAGVYMVHYGLNVNSTHCKIKSCISQLRNGSTVLANTYFSDEETNTAAEPLLFHPSRGSWMGSLSANAQLSLFYKISVTDQTGNTRVLEYSTSAYGEYGGTYLYGFKVA